MVELKVFCDKCHERVTQDRTLLKTQSGPKRLVMPTLDLCSSCLDELVTWLDALPAGCTAPHPRASKVNRITANGGTRP